jgi:lipopolysaccharide transport system permease protein
MEVVIKPDSGTGYWRDLWSYRELFWFLTWRDLLIRYKQTAVGIGWAVLRPVLGMLALTLVFGRFAKLPSEGAPYPVLVLAGLLPWQFFSNALSEGGTSLLNNSNLVSKIYFPRMIIPASAVVTAMVEFAISLLLLAALMWWQQYVPSWRVLFLPLFIILSLLCAAGTGLWISALMIRYRDVRMVLPFILQFGFFLSPIGYSSSVVPARWHLLYSLNPLVGIIDGFRWSILNGPAELTGGSVLISVGMSLFVIVSGAIFFRRVERTLADVI